ncbi:MAG: 30S ribosomal protein S20 [Patescibacteria group bacterium]|jgi:small subunit ribosomal protein S20
MPNIKSAKKELRKANRRHAFNVAVKSELKDLIKKSRKAVEAKDAKSEDLVKKTLKTFDKAVQKGVVKKNTASRGKSRLQLRLNASKK